MKQSKVINVSRTWFDEEREPVRGAKRVVIRPAIEITASTRLISVKAASLILGVSIWTVYDLMSAGKLLWQPVGKRKKTTVEWIKRYLEQESATWGVG